MAIRFSNGFGVGASNNGGAGVSPFWVESTAGYTELTGGVNNPDDGYFNDPIQLPYDFFQDNNGGSVYLYVSTNGVLSLGNGYDNCCPNSPQANNYLFAGNPGDQFLNPGDTLSDGSIAGAWYKITDYGTDVFKVEVKVFNKELDSDITQSYQINLYRDTNYQYMETWCKSNLSTYGSPSTSGPSNVDDVSIPVSLTRNTWRSDLNGLNWENLGNVNVTLNNPYISPTPTPSITSTITPTPSITPSLTPSSIPLSQFTPNGTTGSNGLLTYLNYTNGLDLVDSTLLPDSSGFNNPYAWAVTNPYSGGTTGYTFDTNSYAYASDASSYNLGFNSLTIEMWVKLPTIPSTMSLLSAGGNSSGGWALRIDGGGTQLNLVKYNIADQSVNLPYTLQTDTWYHIVAAQGGTSLTFFINGVIVGAVNTGASNNFSFPNGTVNISKDYYTTTNEAMSLGILKVYDYCLLATDVVTEFEDTKLGYGFVGATPTPTPSATPTPSVTSTITPTASVTPTPSSGSSSAGYLFYSDEGPVNALEPTSQGNIIFIYSSSYETYNPDYSGGTLNLYFNRYAADGSDNLSAMTTLDSNGGLISMSQNGNTATYTGTSSNYTYFGTYLQLVVTSSGQQTGLAGTSFVSGVPISVTFNA